jgi:D-alanine transaminase
MPSDIRYFNGSCLPSNQVFISPDDRGFLFADGIYEVVRWYAGSFFDMDGHMTRLARSLKETRIEWPGMNEFPSIAGRLIDLNSLNSSPALVYLQVTRGAAPRTHTFPSPPVNPTVYAFAKSFSPESAGYENGMPVMLKKDLRWGRCDIKSVALLPNTMCYQEAKEKGFGECVFERDGFITEGSHSNILFVRKGEIFTHPESESILAGITRKNALRLARQAGITVNETAVKSSLLTTFDEAFLTNTSAEVTPVTMIGDTVIGTGRPGPVTNILRDLFRKETSRLRK